MKEYIITKKTVYSVDYDDLPDDMKQIFHKFAMDLGCHNGDIVEWSTGYQPYQFPYEIYKDDDDDEWIDDDDLWKVDAQKDLEKLDNWFKNCDLEDGTHIKDGDTIQIFFSW